MFAQIRADLSATKSKKKSEMQTPDFLVHRMIGEKLSYIQNKP